MKGKSPDSLNNGDPQDNGQQQGRGGKDEQTRRDSKLLDADEAGQLLIMSRKALYAMNSRREIPFIKIGRRVRYERAALEAYIEKRRVPVMVANDAGRGGGK